MRKALFLNSQPFRTVVSGYIVDNCVSTHPVSNIIIPQFDPTEKLHSDLVVLSRAAHDAALIQEEDTITSVEQTINDQIHDLWDK